jgi:hypothetical protein
MAPIRFSLAVMVCILAMPLALHGQTASTSTATLPRFYEPASAPEAQAAALKAHLPLGWVVCWPPDLTILDPTHGPSPELCQMTARYLKGRAIMIVVGSPPDLATPFPKVYEVLGKDIDSPTVMISSPDGATVYGRLSGQDVEKGREKAIAAVLAKVPGYPAEKLKPDPPAPVVPVAVAPPPVAPAPAPAPTPAPAAPKPWTAPDVMPAQPNWTWTTTDGRTYQNVVVTKMEADSVTITHSLGVAHIQVFFLPPELKKQLNYP